MERPDYYFDKYGEFQLRFKYEKDDITIEEDSIVLLGNPYGKIFVKLDEGKKGKKGYD